MVLPFIIEPPPAETGWQEWLFNHARDHQEIINALKDQFNATLPLYNLDQFNSDSPDIWMQQHQQAHNDMNGALGIAGNDLETVDWKKKNEVAAWFFLNYSEHQAVRSTLNI